jgi:hypothetical protein
VGDILLVAGLADLFGTEYGTCYLDVLFVFSLYAFGIEFVAKFSGGIVAVFLESMDLAGEAAE